MRSDLLIRPGSIVEIVGGLSSGRMSLLTTCIRDVTRSGALAALVDADHVFDPLSAERAGVDLQRVLWVRCAGRRDAALRAVDVLVRCPGFGLVALDAGETPPRVSLADAFRLRLAVRRAAVALVLVGRRRVVGSAAALCVSTSREAVAWTGPGARATRLAAMETAVHVVRDQRASLVEDHAWRARWTA
jgi:RecA DNA recombination protein